MIEANYDEVICPNCGTQFRAIPVNVQDQIRRLESEIEGLTREQVGLRLDAERYRWLRSSRHDQAQVMTYLDGLEDWVPWADLEDVDTSVDEAMLEAAKETK